MISLAISFTFINDHWVRDHSLTILPCELTNIPDIRDLQSPTSIQTQLTHSQRK